MQQQHMEMCESRLLANRVCGCSVCFALQLSLCASQHLGSYHDAYHLQILQVTTPYNVYQNMHAHTVLVQTRSVYHSAASHA